MPVANLRRVLKYFDADPGTADFLEVLKLKQDIRSCRGVVDMAFICCLYQRKATEGSAVIRHFLNVSSLTQSFRTKSEWKTFSLRLFGKSKMPFLLRTRSFQLKRQNESTVQIIIQDNSNSSPTLKDCIALEGIKNTPSKIHDVRKADFELTRNGIASNNADISSSALSTTSILHSCFGFLLSKTAYRISSSSSEKQKPMQLMNNLTITTEKHSRITSSMHNVNLSPQTFIQPRKKIFILFRIAKAKIKAAKIGLVRMKHERLRTMQSTYGFYGLPCDKYYTTKRYFAEMMSMMNTQLSSRFFFKKKESEWIGIIRQS